MEIISIFSFIFTKCLINIERLSRQIITFVALVTYWHAHKDFTSFNCYGPQFCEQLHERLKGALQSNVTRSTGLYAFVPDLYCPGLCTSSENVGII